MDKKYIIIAGAVVILGVVGFIMFFSRGIVHAPESNHGLMLPTDTMQQANPVQSSSTLSFSPEYAYTGPSFSFNYPSSWKAFLSPWFSLDNFNDQYQKGQVIPPGGAEIDVVTTTIYGSLQDIMGTELAQAMHLTTSTTIVDQLVCQKASFQADYAPGAVSQDISVYCVRGNKLWKIYFYYPAGDPAEKNDISDFNTVLTSMKLLP